MPYSSSSAYQNAIDVEINNNYYGVASSNFYGLATSSYLSRPLRVVSRMGYTSSWGAHNTQYGAQGSFILEGASADSIRGYGVVGGVNADTTVTSTNADTRAYGGSFSVSGQWNTNPTPGNVAALRVVDSTTGTHTSGIYALYSEGDSHFDGDITSSGDVRSNLYCDSAGSNCFAPSVVGGALWTESGGNIYRSSGNVGIGTTSTTHRLTVAGSADISGNLNVRGGTGSISSSSTHAGLNVISAPASISHVSLTSSDGAAYAGRFAYHAGNNEVSLTNHWADTASNHADILIRAYGSGDIVLDSRTGDVEVSSDLNVGGAVTIADDLEVTGTISSSGGLDLGSISSIGHRLWNCPDSSFENFNGDTVTISGSAFSIGCLYGGNQGGTNIFGNTHYAVVQCPGNLHILTGGCSCEGGTNNKIEISRPVLLSGATGWYAWYCKCDSKRDDNEAYVICV